MVLIRRDEGYRRKYVAAARAGLIAGAALILCAASSNPPAPGGGIGNQPPKPPSESHADAPKQNQQGTQQNPFIVQAINTKENYPESTKASQENSDEAANWWLVRLTFGLIVVGLIQAGVFWVQANRLKETITKMDEIDKGQTAKMTEYIAQATRSADAMTASAEAARKLTELAVKRPWVFVSGVHSLQMKPAKGNDEREPLTTPQGRVFVEYTAANHGEAPAIIEEVFCDLMIVVEAYKPQVARREHRLMISPILGPAEAVSIKEFLPPHMFKSDGGLVVDLDEGTTVPAPEIPDGQELFFWIIVRYRGISTAGHETSALWRFEKNAGLTFMHTGGEERNYAK